MVTEQQRRMLSEDLPRDVVKTRDQAGQRLSYVDGHYAVMRANEVFGPDGWGYSVREMREVYRGTKPGRASGEENTVLIFEALVAVTALGITREDVGIGQCDASLRALAQGIEKGRKEAVTDALKRALRTFGPSFGLALYDKEQRDVGISRAAMALRDSLSQADDPDAWAKEHADEVRSLDGDERDELRALLHSRREDARRAAVAEPRVQLADLGIETPRALPETLPAPAEKRDLVAEVRESAAVRHTVRELADLWRGSREELKAASLGAAGWKAIADRAIGLKLLPAAVKAEVERLDADRGPKGDGPKGGAKPATTKPTDATGESVAATPATGTQASATAWRESREGITAHVAAKGAMLALERSGRAHLRDVPEGLRLHALHAYAGRYQRLSHDGTSALAADECMARAERWMREGPVVSTIPAKGSTAKRAAGGE